jgi:ADP-ribosylglycohydrolase/fructose-1,6-bisphosphatase/inositol monophosphatase family enzyme
MPSYTHALEMAVEAALAAGAILRAELHRDGGPRGGEGKAPADTDAEREIRRRLLEACPSWGYVGEETGTHPAADPEAPIWLVDPNDGTSSFLKGWRGSTVSIALIDDGVPVLGVLYAFAAPDDRGDLFAWADGGGPPIRNGRAIPRAPWAETLGASHLVLLSDRADGKPEVNARLVSPARFRAVTSIAYRLALAAAGEAEAAVSVNSPGAWDYAAGHALIRATGGEFLDEGGRPVGYSRDGRSQTRWCFGGAPHVVRNLAARDWSAIGCAPRAGPEPYDLVRLERGRRIADSGRLSRAQGCLLGQLAGDALGSLVEFQSAERILRAYPEGVRHLTDGGTHDTIAGQPTDDSEMALALARSLVTSGWYDEEAAAKAYRFWFRSRPFDCGSTVMAALGAIDDQDVAAGGAAAAARAAANPESQANGSLMRASPLGIWGHARPPGELARLARADASLTHPHPACGDATAAFVIAIARGIGDAASASAMYDCAAAWASAHARDGSVVDALRAARDAPPREYLRNQGFVLVALQNAFFQLLHAPSLEEGIVRTVTAGGDTDTNAAIAGALIGAAYGREAIPARWRDTVLSCRPIDGLRGVRRPRPRAFWPVDALELAERLLLAGCGTL